MSRVLRLLPDAEQELAAAAQWYEARCAGLGIDLLAAVDMQLTTIREHPERCPRLHAERAYRTSAVRRFPYRIVFTFDRDEVRVVAVAHTSRRPAYWRER